MTELFNNIPEEVKQQARNFVEFALKQPNPMNTVRMVADYAKSCNDSNEQEFVDFYFRMRLEKINESYND